MTADVTNALTSESVSAVDKSALVGDILTMADHIDDALFKAESAMIEPAEARSLVVCGMGGSAIGADLAVAAIGDRLHKPVTVVRGYDLPSWVGSEDAILVSSYSGSTEETLSCYEQARSLGAKIYVTSSGGPASEIAQQSGHPVIALPGIFQPRAAVAYGVTAVTEIAIATGAAPSALRKELAEAAVPLRELADMWSPSAADDALPKRLARQAFGRVASVYGAGLTAPVATRWRSQINENAKAPATEHVLPESNHNEICAWESAREVVEQTAWFLRDSDQHDRIKRRIELTAETASAHGARAEIVDTVGDSRFDRLFSSILLGDLMSLYLAVLRGVDPSPVPVIENLKDSLGRPAGS